MNLPRSELLDQLIALDPYDFEKLVGDVWEYMGWNATVTQRSADRGKDIVARKELPFPQKQLIQVKKYSQSNKVSIEEVQQYGSLYLDNSSSRDVDADVVAIVTTSSLTRPAQQKAQEIGVRVVDGGKLTQMILEWDLSEIVSDYIQADSSSGPALNGSIKDLRDTEGWNVIESFNSQGRSSTGENLKLTVSVNGSTAYTLYHGHSHQDELSERKNIHYLKGIDDQQVDRLKHIMGDLNMKISAGSESDVWRIYDKGEGVPKARRTVEIGARILNGIYGVQFEDAEFEVEISRENSASRPL